LRFCKSVVRPRQAAALAAEAEAAATRLPEQPSLAEAEALLSDAQGSPVSARLLRALAEVVEDGRAWESEAQQCARAHTRLLTSPAPYLPCFLCVVGAAGTPSGGGCTGRYCHRKGFAVAGLEGWPRRSSSISPVLVHVSSTDMS